MKPVDRFRRALEQIIEMADRSDSHPDLAFGVIARKALEDASESPIFTPRPDDLASSDSASVDISTDPMDWVTYSFKSDGEGTWEVHDEDGDDGTLLARGTIDEVLAGARKMLAGPKDSAVPGPSVDTFGGPGSAQTQDERWRQAMSNMGKHVCAAIGCTNIAGEEFGYCSNHEREASSSDVSPDAFTHALRKWGKQSGHAPSPEMVADLLHAAGRLVSDENPYVLSEQPELYIAFGTAYKMGYDAARSSAGQDQAVTIRNDLMAERDFFKRFVERVAETPNELHPTVTAMVEEARRALDTPPEQRKARVSQPTPGCHCGRPWLPGDHSVLPNTPCFTGPAYDKAERE